MFPIQRKKRPATSNSETKIPDVIAIELDKLVPFSNHPFQIYEGERLEKFADSIRDEGLFDPIIVRSHNTEKEKYEILSGHNRVEAAKLLKWKTINAILKRDISDERAERIVIQGNLNQQSFADWKFSQQINIIKIYNKHIQEDSQQGKRSDLEIDDTCVQSEHKSTDKPKRPKTRDKISKQLGISSTVFERYRSIAKLDNEAVNILGAMLDEKRLGFMSTYRIS